MSGLTPTGRQYRELFRDLLQTRLGADFECLIVTPAAIRLKACHLIAKGTLDGQQIKIYADCQNVRSMPWKVWMLPDDPDHAQLKSSDSSLHLAIDNFVRRHFRQKRK